MGEARVPGRSAEEGLQAALEEARAAGLELVRSPDGLLLTDWDLRLVADLSQMKRRLRPGRLQAELLVKAARIKGAAAPTALDMTAGLGNDSLLLAAAGFTVTLCERDHVIAALLRDALERAAFDPELRGCVERMHVAEGDSVEALAALGCPPDVVYLDPMFPERHKSAAVKKKFQLLHHLERPCEDEGRMLEAALAASPRKVVVKRPVKGGRLAGAKPSYSVAGKAVRYDVIVPPRPAAGEGQEGDAPGARS